LPDETYLKATLIEKRGSLKKNLLHILFQVVSLLRFIIMMKKNRFMIRFLGKQHDFQDNFDWGEDPFSPQMKNQFSTESVKSPHRYKLF
jgi:hypothetical protein